MSYLTRTISSARLILLPTVVGWNDTRTLSSLMCICHTGPLFVMDEPHSGCTPNVTPGGLLPATPTSHSCTNDCTTADSSS